MDNYLKKLDEILLSYNARTRFFDEYNNNKDFKTWLLSFLPEIDACVNQKQNNPWHIYDVMNHILVSVENMNKLTTQMSEVDKRVLAYAMFLHDIGKPECHITRQKNGKTIDSFFNHNKAGQKIVLRVGEKLGFSTADTISLAKLVEDHDIFMFLTIDKTQNPYKKQLDSKYVEEEIKKLDLYGNGQKLNRMISLIGRCDSLAQNPEMTQDSLKLLDVYEEITSNVMNCKKDQDISQ